MKRWALAALPLAFLVGCGDSSAGAGVGADSKQSASVTRERSMTESRELNSSRAQESTVERNLLPFIVDGVGPLVKFGGDVATNSQICRFAMEWTPEDQAAQEAQVIAAYGPDVLSRPEWAVNRWLFESDLQDIATACAAWQIQNAFVPVQGWGIDPVVSKSEMLRRVAPQQSPEKLAAYLGGTLASMRAVAGTMSRIAEDLDARPAMTEAEYRQAVGELLPTYAGEHVAGLQAALEDGKRQQYTTCTVSGCNNVEFSTQSGYALSMGLDGPVLSQHGLVLLGDGMINGRRHVAAVSASNGATMSRQSGSGTSDSLATGQSVGGQVKTN